MYDNSNVGNELVRDVIGSKHFGEIVIKRKSLEEYFREFLNEIYGYNYQWKKIDNLYYMYQSYDELKRFALEEEFKVLHFFSNFIIIDEEKVKITFKKFNFINDNIILTNEKQIVAVMFCDIKEYLEFLKNVTIEQSVKKVIDELNYEQLEIDGVINLEKIGNLIQCVTGNFDSRYFNSLQGDEFFITKSSKNKIKIKKEYTFYQLLPENMKVWFVQPFDYKENDKFASYTMKRYHMTDLAIKWVHGSIGKQEFEEILRYYFFFFNSRHKKKVSQSEYDRINEELFDKKVRSRIQELESKKEFETIKEYIYVGTKYRSIEKVLEKYYNLKKKIEKKVSQETISVIGHGDPCFANTLYNRATKTVLFIDPKGGLTEDEIWTNPYYDIAKLSHSVCGLYDFFNTGLFSISISEEFQLKLTIEFDNYKYKQLFKKILEENGYDYKLIRLYEASLFLSMLPLHIDYPHKVLAFLLNAIQILEEIENEI